MSWYDPKDASSAIPEGWYPASIDSVEMKHSDKVGEMQKVAFRVYGPREVVIYEYFHAKSLWKYKALAKALGKLPEFNAGHFDAKDFLNKNLDIELGIKDSPEYGEQNTSKGFAPDGEQCGVRPAGSGGTRTGLAKGETIDHDDIPF